MGGASDRSVYGGKTPHKHSHAVARKSEKPPSKESMTRDKVDKYIQNDDGNPVAGSSSQSTSDRQARVNREVEASLAKLKGGS
ncbi:uncharacterized protein PG998_010301 [Apiospora kogelbergensis]|uniref:uncharacterized protein n=1 Tax=Apiospora kogelbergensis TaxID=1337665 RepID=UPI00312EA9AF